MTVQAYGYLPSWKLVDVTNPLHKSAHRADFALEAQEMPVNPELNPPPFDTEHPASVDKEDTAVIFLLILIKQISPYLNMWRVQAITVCNYDA